jgi:hypothetical protein
MNVGFGYNTYFVHRGGYLSHISVQESQEKVSQSRDKISNMI